MSPEAYIFGLGGHARVIRSLLSRTTRVCFVALESGPGCLAEDAFFALKPAAPVYLGIGDSQIRRRLFEKLSAHGLSARLLVARHAFVSEEAKLGEGAVICPGAIVMTGARVGENTIVNTLSSVDHDCVVGPHCQLAAGVNLGGGAILGSGVFLGMKSVVLPGVHVGDGTEVMAGSVVTENVGPNLIVGGYPARPLRRL